MRIILVAFLIIVTAPAVTLAIADLVARSRRRRRPRELSDFVVSFGLKKKNGDRSAIAVHSRDPVRE